MNRQYFRQLAQKKHRITPSISCRPFTPRCTFLCLAALLFCTSVAANQNTKDTLPRANSEQANHYATLKKANRVRSSSPQKSRSLIEGVLNAAQRSGHQILEAESRLMLGTLANADQEWSKARSLFTQARQLAASNNNDNIVIRSFYNGADTGRFSGNFDEAHQSLNQGLAIAESINDHELILRGYNYRGNIYKSEEKFEQALKSYEKSLEIGKKHQFAALQARAHRNIAKVYEKLDNPRATLKHLEKNVDIASSHNDLKSTVAGLLKVGRLHKKLGQNEAALASFLQALEFPDHFSSKTVIANTHQNIARIYSLLDNLDGIVDHNQKALAIIKSLPNANDSQINKHLEAILVSQRKLGLYAESVQNGRRVLSAYRRLNNTKGLENVLLNLTIAYRKLGIYDFSIEYASEFLILNEQANDFNGIASANNQIAMAYTHLGQYENAMSYYEKTTAVPSDTIHSKYRASALRGIANLLHIRGDHYPALKHLNQAMILYNQNNNTRGLESVHRLRGQILHALNDNDEALAAYKIALKQSRKMGALWSEASNLIHMGLLFVETQPEKARKLITEGNQVAEEQATHPLLIDGYNAFITLDRHLGNYKEALEYMEKKREIADEMYKNEVKQRIADLRVSREVEEKERKILNLERRAKIDSLELQQKNTELDIITKANTISKLKLANERTVRALLIFVIFFTLLVLAILYWRFRYVRSVQTVLHENNKQIEAKNKQLEELNATKDRFLSIVAHDLRGPISALATLTGLLKDNMEEFSKEQVRKQIHALHETSEQTHRLVEELLEWAMIQVRNTDPIPRDHNIAALCMASMDVIEVSANAKNIRISCTIDQDLTCYADQNMIKTVFRNILSNAIKFSPTNGKVTIYATKENHQVHIHIKDNGIGIKAEHIPILFNIDKKLSSVGTAGEKGTGFGLALCKEFVNKNGGEIWADNTVTQGAHFIFSLPTAP